MNWTTQPPASPGWYWFLEDGEFLPVVVFVDNYVYFIRDRREQMKNTRGKWKPVEDA